MRAQLRSIEPNDFYCEWERFAAAERVNPHDSYGWFTLSIGHEGGVGADLFQVLISTPAAASRARGPSRYFAGIIVESFEPNLILKTLRDYVSATSGESWQEIVDQLRLTMRWEYEGMHRNS